MFIEALFKFPPLLPVRILIHTLSYLVDYLSRNQLSSFLHKVLEADQLPTPNLPAATASALRPTGRLDVSRLEDSVQFYFQQGLAPSTRKTYQSVTHHFHNFCTAFNITNPFAVTEKPISQRGPHLSDVQVIPGGNQEHATVIGLALTPGTSHRCLYSRGCRQVSAESGCSTGQSPELDC